MKFLLHIVVLFFALSVSAQDTTRFICSFPEMPEFPGGEGAFGKYLQDSIHYPAEEKANRIEGVVYVYFEVNVTGKIENVRIQRGVENGPGLNAEALRVITAMPDWTPAKMDGKAQKLGMMQPIRFTLDAGNSSRPVSRDTLKNDTIPAQFPGGSMAQSQFITTHVKYPRVAKEKGHQGDVLVQYDVETDGSITNVRIWKGVEGAPELEEEAIRVVNTFPKHTPATVNGKPVKFTMMTAVRYKLQ